MFNQGQALETQTLLKEPLISNGNQQDIENFTPQTPILQQESLGNQIQDPNGQQISNKDQIQQQGPDEVGRVDDEKPPIVMHNFYQENEMLIQSKKGSGQRDDQTNDLLSFHKQASAVYQLPTNQIIDVCYLKSDPQKYAVITRASNFFQDENLQLRELICLSDYKILERLRVRNFFYLARLIVEMDLSKYKVIKRKLLQLKNLCEYLGLINEPYDYDDKGSTIYQVFQRLENNMQIYDLQDEPECNSKKFEDISMSSGEESDKESQKEDEYENVYDEDGDYGEEDEDLEHQKYFGSSKLNIQFEESYQQALMKEEERWIKRVEWLEAIIQELQEKQSKSKKISKWMKYFEIKLQELQSLDVPLKSVNNKSQNGDVFYVHKYQKEQLKDQNKVKGSQENNDLEAAYGKDEQIYVEEQILYPKVNFDMSEAKNDNVPFSKSTHNIREKFCLRVQSLEAQTEYFLTVYHKKSFGSEKIYEKRLNMDGMNVQVEKMEFNAKATFIYVSFKISKGAEDSKDSQIVQLIFPVQAQHKDPLLVEQNTDFLCFHESQFYSYEIVEKTVKSSSPQKQAKEEDMMPFDKILEKDETQSQNDSLEIQSPDHEGDTFQEQIFDDYDVNKKQKNRKHTYYARASTNIPYESKKSSIVVAKKQNNLRQTMTTKKNDNLRQSMPTKNKEKEAFLRVYEYNLENFRKCKVIELKNPKLTKKALEDSKENNWFGKTKEGLYIIFKCDVQAAPQDVYEYQLIKEGKNEVYNLDITDKEHQFKNPPAKDDENDQDPKKQSGRKNQQKKENFIERISINEKGDKIMLIYKSKENGIQFARLIYDKKKTYVQDSNDFRQLKEHFPCDDAQGKYKIEIVPTQNDFIILAQNSKKDNDNNCISVFFNDQFQTKVVTNPSDLSFNVEENVLKNIYDVKKFYYLDVIKHQNKFTYSEWGKKGDKFEWHRESHEFINNQKITCFPYVFFFYNHDQLYMKDLSVWSKDQKPGYFFLNNFLGIDERMRPLTVYCYKMMKTFTVNIPIIQTNYDPSYFQLRVNSLFTRADSSNPMKLTKTHLNYNVYGFNQMVNSSIFKWAELITTPEGHLEKDVRFKFENNCFKIEKWKKDFCKSRFLISHHHQQYSLEDNQIDRDEIYHKDAFPDTQNDDEAKRVILLQTQERVIGFTFNHDHLQSEEPVDFSENDIGLYQFFEYTLDDDSNPIKDIFVDPFIENQFDIYILHKNNHMQKFIGKIPNKNSDVKQTVVEYPHIYDISRVFTIEEKIKKPINHNDIIIANGMMYSNQIIIDTLALNDKLKKQLHIINLKAEIFKERNQLGEDFKNPYMFQQKDEAIQFLGISENEAKITMLKPGNLVDELVVAPLFNSRVIPLFQESQFQHPIVPIIDENRGYCVVFSLNIEQTLNNPSSSNKCTHGNSKYYRWGKYFNVNPGLIIKYFNGVEQAIPIQERFLRINRFVMSKDGHQILLTGIKYGKVLESGEISVEEGLFLYQIDKLYTWKVTLRQQILFAKKKTHSSDTNSQILKKNKLTFSESEEILPVFGEFNQIDEDDLKYLYGVPICSYTQNLGLNDNQSDDDEDDNQKQQAELNVDVQKNKLNEKQQYLDTESLLSSQLETQFEGFDIPYHPFRGDPDKAYSYIPDLIDKMLEMQDLTMFNQTTNDENKSEIFLDIKKFTKHQYKSKQINYIGYMLSNLHLQVNELGHIFLINRLTNQIYFFYQNKDNDYKLFKLRLNEDQPIFAADSTQNHLVIWGKTFYKLYDISDLYNCVFEKKIQHQTQGNNQKLAEKQKLIQRLSLPIPKTDPKYLAAINKTPKDDNSIPEELLESDYNSQGAEGQEKYQFNYYDILIYKNKLYMKVESDDIKYLKIFNFETETLVNYIEYSQIMISGDKRYIWQIEENRVLDIENNLTTFLIWPGDQINHHDYIGNESFNVNNSGTIMSTQGYLQLSFHLLHGVFHSDYKKYYSKGYMEYYLRTSYDEKSLDYKSRPYFLFYKIKEGESLIDTIMQKDREDEENLDPILDKNKLEQREQELYQQQSLIQKVANYINQRFEPDLDDAAHFASFFLSYYTTKTINKQVQTQKSMQNQILALIQTGTLKEQEKCRHNIFEVFFIQSNPRYDIVEEILRIVVKAVNLPILIPLINKSFLDFLKNGNNSQSFRDYLNNGMMKTIKMEELENYPIISTDQGYKLDSYVSPIMDEGFNRKFQDKGESKKDVQIQYIFLGDLLVENGEQIMEQLCDIKFLEMMSIPFIQYIVLHQWNKIKNSIVTKTLYPFFTLLALFTLFSVGFADYSVGVKGFVERDIGMVQSLAYEICSIFLLINLTYFFAVEVKQCFDDFKEYFSSGWNLIDLANYSLCLAVLFFDLLGIQSYQRPLASIALIILWIKLFYFLRVFDETSQLIRMIIEIVNDMKNFMIVLMIGIVAFTGGLYIMQQVVPETNDAHNFVGDNVVKAFIYTYRLTLGDFQLDNFQQVEDIGYTFEFYFLWFIFIFGSLFLVIVLLNLLIAIMGSTFERTSEGIQNLTIREKVLLVFENESLMARKLVFKKDQFLILISEKKSEGSEAENNEIHMQEVKALLNEKIACLESEIKGQIVETQKELKKRFTEQEEQHKSTKSKIYEDVKNTKNELSQKIECLQELILNQTDQVKIQFDNLSNAFNEIQIEKKDKVEQKAR